VTATRVGVVGGTRGALVDEVGTLSPERAVWRLAWWIGADDRWHLPRREHAVRQTRVDHLPVLRTAMRIPGGDALEHVYGAEHAALVEITNESPAPFVAALVVEGAKYVALDGATLVVDGRPAIVTPRPPSRWAVSVDGSTERVVTSGQASEDRFAPRVDRGARLVAAFLYPVAHRTTLRVGVALSPRDTFVPADLARIPGREAVVRGWRAHLDRGLQVQIPDAALSDAVVAARSDLLLAGQAWLPDPLVVAALEDWGFDDEALAAWARLSGRARRRLRRRQTPPADWERVSALGRTPGPEFLLALRAACTKEEGGVLHLLPAYPAAWRGMPLDVRDLPTRLGALSFSVRWHGERPALLWDAPAGARLDTPGLDPAWSSEASAGEALLGSWPGAA
jgi:hypothetical protein